CTNSGRTPMTEESTLDELVEQLKQDSTERREYQEALGAVVASNRRRSWFQFVGTVCLLVPLLFLVVQTRHTQVDGVKRNKTILSLVQDTHESATILRCAID